MVFVDSYHCNHGNHIFRLREGVTRLTTTMCKLSSLPTQAITNTGAPDPTLYLAVDRDLLVETSCITC